MIEIHGNDIRRGGEKIGWIEDNRIFSHSGEKVGYFKDNDIYYADGRKIGYIEGDYLKTVDSAKIRLEDNREQISGGSISDLARAAVRLLLGE